MKTIYDYNTIIMLGIYFKNIIEKQLGYIPNYSISCMLPTFFNSFSDIFMENSKTYKDIEKYKYTYGERWAKNIFSNNPNELQDIAKYKYSSWIGDCKVYPSNILYEREITLSRKNISDKKFKLEARDEIIYLNKDDNNCKYYTLKMDNNENTHFTYLLGILYLLYLKNNIKDLMKEQYFYIKRYKTTFNDVKMNYICEQPKVTLPYSFISPDINLTTDSISQDLSIGIDVYNKIYLNLMEYSNYHQNNEYVNTDINHLYLQTLHSVRLKKLVVLIGCYKIELEHNFKVNGDLFNYININKYQNYNKYFQSRITNINKKLL